MEARGGAHSLFAAAMTLVRPLAHLEPIARSESCFQDLYEAHFSFVWRTLRRLGVQAANLSDATQDVFMVVGRRLGDLHSPELGRSWIYGIVVRVAHEHRRSQRRSFHEEAELDEVLDLKARSAHEHAEQAEDVELLDRLLGRLDPEKREVLVLVELEQLSVPEVAQLTGLNLNTVYTRLRAARIAFNEAVQRHRAQSRSRP